MVQLVGAIVSGSVALLADAGHMASDLLALVIALVATVVAARPASDRQTYGYRRAEVLAALANGLLLVGVAVWVAVEAIPRLFGDGSQVEPTTMLVVGVIGGLCNLAALLVLRAGASDSLNMRGAYLEVLGDLLGSAAVVIAAVVILLTGYGAADAIASLVIAAMIVPRALSLLSDVFQVLFASAPKTTDVELIRDHIRGTDGVVDVHDVHVWQITSGANVFSAHVVVDDATFAEGRTGELLDRLSGCLHEHFDVGHSTFQLEPVDHAAREEPTHR